MFEVAYDFVDVAGLNYRREAALNLIDAAQEHPVQIDLVPEPDNQFDENAIKVVGAWADQQAHVGYVPAALADLIRYKRMVGIKAELAHCAVIDEEDYKLVIQIRILAPA